MAVTACSDRTGTTKNIEKSGTLTLITDNNANAYYIYRGRPAGFDYDLAAAFAAHLGVSIEVSTPGWSRMFNALNRGEGDFVAAGLTITEPRMEIVDFSDSYFEVQQQVIVNRRNSDIQKIEDLAGVEVHVRSQTSYQQRLEELNNEGLGVRIKLHQDVPTEELIRQVADGEIEVTIADSNIAMLNRRYYPGIRLAFAIEEPQHLGWAVRKGDRRLRKNINKFFHKIREDGTYDRIYRRYYSNIQIFDYVDVRRFHQRLDTRLAKYRPIIQRQAEKHGFDWRMIAAMVYQESHFDPQAESHTGVRGLMQVTRATAEEMGIKNRLDPAQSIRAGVGYLAKLYERFDDMENPRDRLLFAMASYNIGYGHVRDAMQLAEKMGLDPRQWSSLKQTLPHLRHRKYYTQTTYGYARGTEPVRYIDRILLYFDIIKRLAYA